jgi:hypothetical protein
MSITRQRKRLAGGVAFVAEEACEAADGDVDVLISLLPAPA